jgi:hypothetical protein
VDEPTFAVDAIAALCAEARMRELAGGGFMLMGAERAVKRIEFLAIHEPPSQPNDDRAERNVMGCFG